MKVVERFPRAVRVLENVWVPLSDGCRLAARIWLPEDAEARPVPALIESLPYRKRDFTRLRDEPLHHYYAGHGYASIRLDLRGAGDSEGLLLDEYPEQEQDDLVETIAWVARQPWCDGGVGLFGVSWGGFNALQVAARRPPALRAIVTICSTDDRYEDDAHYKGGGLLNENLVWGASFLACAACPPDPAIVGERWRGMWRERLENAVLYPAVWMRHPWRDDYWRHGSVCEDYAAIECPVYAVGGWADGYSNAIPRLLQGLRAPCKALIGPWAHAFPSFGLPGPAVGFYQESLRWWDQWLKGVDTGIRDEPAYRVWMEESVRPAPFHAERPGRWVAEEGWPSGRTRPRRFHLNVLSLGSAPDPEDRMHVASPQSVGLGGGDWYGFGAEGDAPIDQREDDGKSLVFDSDPLEARLEILGAPQLSLELAADRPVATVVARLLDVAPDGASTRVSYGVLNLCQRESRERPEALEPGRRYRVALSLNHAAYAFPAGHTLRVALSTSYWPMLWPPPEPVRLTVFTGASALELPERPPRAGDEMLAPFPPPERGPVPEHTALRRVPYRRTVERDLTTNETLYRTFSDGGDFGGASLARIEAIDLTVGYTIEKLYRIHEYDPSTARATIEQQVSHQRGDWSTRVECWTELSADREAFRLRARLEAYENDRPFASRTWDERIPRRLL